MMSKFRKAVDILQKEGVPSLIQATVSHYLNKFGFIDTINLNRSLKQVRARVDSEEDLDDILDTVLDVKPGQYPYEISASQYRYEIKNLAEIIKKEDPKTVLEIGTASGGTLYIWARYLDSVEKIISLDLPGGDFGGGYNKNKMKIFKEFAPSKDMHFVRKDSHERSTFEEISKISDGVDFLFIDGDHSYQGVKQDYKMYSKLVSEGGIIAFHDIVETPDNQGIVQKRREKKEEYEGLENKHLVWGDGLPNCEVSKFWEELAEENNTEEIISHPKQSHMGIGILRV